MPDAELIISNLTRLTDYAYSSEVRSVASADEHVDVFTPPHVEPVLQAIDADHILLYEGGLAETLAGAAT